MDNNTNKPKTSINLLHRDRELSLKTSCSDSLYFKFLNYLYRLKSNDEHEKVFKTKIIKPKEFVKCDVCGERIKIDELSLYSPTINMGGHFNHILNFINDNHLPRYLGK